MMGSSISNKPQLTFGQYTLSTHWHRVTDTCMHIWILTADYTVKPVLRGHSKMKTNYSLMLVKSIAGAFCNPFKEHSAILSTFIKLPFVIKIFDLSFFEWLLKTGFTLLTTYMYFLFCWVHRLAVRWIFENFSQLIRMGPLGPLPWQVMGHILKSWDNDPGPP